MKKALRRVLVAFMALALFMGGIVLPENVVKAAEDEYLVFIAIGADSTEEGASWDINYYGPDNAGNSETVEAVNATVKNGETATVSLTVPTVNYTWFMAPCVVVGDTQVSSDSTFDYTVKVDGTDITDTIDKEAGKVFWHEATGDYTEDQVIRLGGGYNEWGDKYITESPTGFTTIEYTITLNIVEGAETGDVVESTNEYDAFIAIGADSKEEGASWDINYYGTDSEGIEGTHGTLKNGETTTITLKVPEVNYTWFLAPCINTNGDVFDASTTFDVTVAIDGVDVTDQIDFSAGKAFWNEATGDVTEENCVRIAGGYNEWGDKYMAESPKDFTEISFTITPHIYLGAAAEDAISEVDKDGTYNFYIGIQTAAWKFRNAWDDANYGIESDVFNQLTSIDADNNVVTQAGTFTDVVVAGNGTYKVAITDFDFTDDFASESNLNLLFVDSDMPISDEIQITNVSMIVDGKTVYTFDTAYQDPDSKVYTKVLLENIWNNEIAKFSYAQPQSSIEVEFTVSGFNYDKVEDATEEVAEDTTEEVAEEVTEEVTETPTEEVTEAPAEETMSDSADSNSNTGLVVGIVIAVIVIAGVAVVVVMNKKKQAK